MLNNKIVKFIIVLILLLFALKIIFTVAKLSPFLFQLLFNRDVQLKKSDHNINVLLLGIAGGAHEGPNLSDTIIFASLDQKNSRVTLVSIPRDLWVPDIDGKVNTAYAIGQARRKGGGLVLAEAAVSKVVGQPIDYGLRVDFSGFVKAVDLVGGLSVNVEKSFDDFEYPIDGKEDDTCGHKQEELQALATASSQLEAFPCRYQHIHFDKGVTNMNGETALKFVRSRHAQGDEGSDFARSQRQEKVIKAFKDKVFSLGTLVNPAKVLGLFDILQSSIDTDIKQDEFDDFIRLSQKMRTAKIESAVLDYGDDKTQRPGLLINPQISQDYDSQWVLIPRVGNGDFSEIKKYIDCEIKVGNCPISKNP